MPCEYAKYTRIANNGLSRRKSLALSRKLAMPKIGKPQGLFGQQRISQFLIGSDQDSWCNLEAGVGRNPKPNTTQGSDPLRILP